MLKYVNTGIFAEFQDLKVFIQKSKSFKQSNFLKKSIVD